MVRCHNTRFLLWDGQTIVFSPLEAPFGQGCMCTQCIRGLFSKDIPKRLGSGIEKGKEPRKNVVSRTAALIWSAGALELKLHSRVVWDQGKSLCALWLIIGHMRVRALPARHLGGKVTPISWSQFSRGVWLWAIISTSHCRDKWTGWPTGSEPGTNNVHYERGQIRQRTQIATMGNPLPWLDTQTLSLGGIGVTVN